MKIPGYPIPLKRVVVGGNGKARVKSIWADEFGVHICPEGGSENVLILPSGETAFYAEVEALKALTERPAEPVPRVKRQKLGQPDPAERSEQEEGEEE